MRVGIWSEHYRPLLPAGRLNRPVLRRPGGGVEKQSPGRPIRLRVPRARCGADFQNVRTESREAAEQVRMRTPGDRFLRSYPCPADPGFGTLATCETVLSKDELRPYFESVRCCSR